MTLRLMSAFITAFATMPFMFSSVMAQTAALSLNNATPALVLKGTATSATCASNGSENFQHTIEVTEDSDRRFRVKGDGETSLLLINSQGKRFCIQTDSYSGGEAELTGRWSKGTYRVFVGSRSASKPAYSLSVLPLN